MVEVKPIAFYLPQFYPSGVNDLNWGMGFSEWRSVVKARPLFDGHFQPKLPGMLGFYDLRSLDALAEQADLARSFGLYGFCFYYYRMGTRRLLDRPLDVYLNGSKPDFPFMYCWANESWTRAWDGRSNDVLVEQTYDETTLNGLIADLCNAIRDRRYIRVSGKPFFLIYQLDKLTNRETWLAQLRENVFKITGEELLIGCVFSPGLQISMLKDVDALVQFPPHRIPRTGPRRLLPPEQVAPYELERGDFFETYEVVIEDALTPLEGFERMYPGVAPDWDNSPRRGRNAHILVGSTPKLFEEWVRKACQLSVTKFGQSVIDAPLLFVNSWNEWGEGAMLEPSEVLGTAYLDALASGIKQAYEVSR